MIDTNPRSRHGIDNARSMPQDPGTEDQRLVPIVENVPIARDTYRLRLADPAIARAIRPGQFVMIRPGPEGATDPLLGRPLALYDVVRDPAGAATAFDVVYLVVGRGTAALSRRRPGERVAVWGPLGNRLRPASGRAGRSSWPAASARRRSWLWAAGGWACDGDGRRSRPSAGTTAAITLLYGVRTAALLAGVDDFRRAGIEVELATDDGTAGHHGFVTDLLARSLERGERPAKIVGCGPPAMLAALATGRTSTASPATSRWKTTWRAASARASVASPRSARPTARPTCAGSASKGPSSPPIASIGRGWSLTDVAATRVGRERTRRLSRLASGPGSGRGAWQPARNPHLATASSSCSRRVFSTAKFLRISCSIAAEWSRSGRGSGESAGSCSSHQVR